MSCRFDDQSRSAHAHIPNGQQRVLRYLALHLQTPVIHNWVARRSTFDIIRADGLAIKQTRIQIRRRVNAGKPSSRENSGVKLSELLRDGLIEYPPFIPSILSSYWSGPYMIPAPPRTTTLRCKIGGVQAKPARGPIFSNQVLIQAVLQFVQVVPNTNAPSIPYSGSTAVGTKLDV